MYGNRLNADTVREQARGQWGHILTALGVPGSALTNKHQPCPCCGGRDRFRFDDRQGTGSFICTGWNNGGGDGFSFVRHWLDCSFADALKAVADVLGLDGTSDMPKREKPAEGLETAAKAEKDLLPLLVSVWGHCKPVCRDDAVAAYLAARGLDYEAVKGFSAGALRFCPTLEYRDGSIIRGRHPAMVGMISNPEGEMTGLHRTYLQKQGRKTGKLVLESNGNPLPAKKMLARRRGSTSGGAVRLYPHNGTLAVCEGMETAFAVRQLTGLPVWACLSAHGLQRLVLPSELDELYIFADNDSHKQGTGFQAACRLGVRGIGAGVRVRLWQSETAGYDVLDELNAGNALQRAG